MSKQTFEHTEMHRERASQSFRKVKTAAGISELNGNAVKLSSRPEIVKAP